MTGHGGAGAVRGAASPERDLAVGDPGAGGPAKREEHGAVASGDVTGRSPAPREADQGATAGQEGGRTADTPGQPCPHGDPEPRNSATSGHARVRSAERPADPPWPRPPSGSRGAGGRSPEHSVAPAGHEPRSQAHGAGAEPRKWRAGAGIRVRGSWPHGHATPRTGLGPHGGCNGCARTRVEAALPEPEKEPGSGVPLRGTSPGPSPARSRCWRPPAGSASPPAR